MTPLDLDETSVLELRISKAEEKLIQVRTQARIIVYLSVATLIIGVAWAFSGERLLKSAHLSPVGTGHTVTVGITIAVLGLWSLFVGLLFQHARTTSLRQELAILNTKRKLLT